MKILVTGGAGFIGSALTRHLVTDLQQSVINVDKLTYAGNLESLHSVSDSPHYHFCHNNICDKISLERVFRELHAAFAR